MRVDQLTKTLEKHHLNKLIASRVARVVHQELRQVKFSEKVYQTRKDDTVKSGKGSRKKTKNSKIRFKASKTEHLSEALLDFLVIREKKLKQGK